MTQEEKELLLKDLCGRIPYNVICQFYDDKINRDSDFYDDTLAGKHLDMLQVCIDFYCKPYLRPMTSMTDDEKKVYEHRLECMFYDSAYDVAFAIDWLNAHHFDYRGLIGKGLALEAPKGMYIIKLLS